ncbi:DUF2303 family protein [Oceanicella sp. SM1341]|uniref:DUF2303 family protein n=1 Tax=Oceanicella sp. SM1341 TaxID=1548889 RepID=UPI000E5155EB|nr:DUF2303 family protein [Oceanicella sp. SM1341]
MDTHEPGIAALLTEMRGAYTPRVVEVQGDSARHDAPARYLLTPGEHGTVRAKNVSDDLEALALHPRRIRRKARAETLAAFVAMVKHHREAHSALFLSSGDAPELLAVIDYHAPNGGTPAFCEHTVSYPFPLAPEWRAWSEGNKTAMSQEAFAQHLTDNAIDIIDPLPGLEAAKEEDVPEDVLRLWQYRQAIGGRLATRAQMMQFAEGIEIRAHARVKGKVSLQSGRVGMAWEEDHLDSSGAPLEIPNLFLLSLPVFENGPRYAIAAHLRYRVREGKVTWSYDMHRADLARRDALEGAGAFAQEATELPLFYGSHR